MTSLAQYFPDDPDDPEFPERERAYYKFRRNLEERYPQCCAECEPKVREQLDKANYTAKTDWLRRKLDYSNQTRILLTKTGANYFQDAGKCMWMASYWLQLLWHAMLIQKAVINSTEVPPSSWPMFAARVLNIVFTRLPSPEIVVHWSFLLSLLSFWWNPKWVESFRGFIRHLSGFKQYYTFQAMILLLKLPSFLNWNLPDTPQLQRLAVQVAVNVSTVLAMTLVYKLAQNSIRTDNRKLWLPSNDSILAKPSPTPQGAPAESKRSGEQTMADALDEILHEPTPKPAIDPQPYMAKFSAADQFDHMPTPGARSSYDPSTPSLGPNPFQSTTTTPKRPTTSGSNMGFSSLSLSDQPQTRAQTRSQTQSRQPAIFQQQQQQQQPVPQYQEDMEWTHTTPQNRAFGTYQPGQPTEKRGFNETPTTNKSGVFWAKIPPKPTTPAQRAFNPLNRPVIRTSPVTQVKNPLGFQGSSTGGISTSISTGSTMFGQHRQQPQLESSSPGATASNTIFAQPSLLLPPRPDERDLLAEAFTQSFSISSGSGDGGGGAGGGSSGSGPAGDARRDRTAQGSDLAYKLKYLFLGLCLAVVGNVAYNYFLQVFLSSSTKTPTTPFFATTMQDV